MERSYPSPSPVRLTRPAAVLSGVVLASAIFGCDRSDTKTPDRVVLYTSLDRSFSEPIVEEFQRQTGVRIDTVYDTESTKTIGLVNRIRAEGRRPRCDVFWNNEIINTVLLERDGLLRAVHPGRAGDYPPELRSPGGWWHGFAARARVLIVNTSLVSEADTPRSMFDLLDAKWKGRVGIAKPVAGTTATHVACLFAVLGAERAKAYLRGLRANDVRIEPGNKSCAEGVGAGRLLVAWTDTDDAVIELESGSPVRIIYPDVGADGIGALFIPNTLAALRDSPNSAGADRLIDYLLDASVENRLAAGPSAQIPLNRNRAANPRVKGPGEVKPMAVDFTQAATAWEPAQRFIRTEFLP